MFGCDSIVTTTLNINANQVDEINNSSTISESTQFISLKKGWNVFSAYLLPDNLSMDNVLENLAMDGNLKSVIDEYGNTYEELKNGTGWKNDIGSLSLTEGYEIQVNSNCVLKITGKTIDLPININLKKGWNIISFPYNEAVDAMQVLQPLINNGILEKVLDESGKSVEIWRNRGWVNQIGNFEGGEGYKVLVNSDGILQINNPFIKSGSISLKDAKTQHYDVEYIENGYCHMNINILELDKTILDVNDEVAVFDGSVCVGALRVTPNDLNNAILSIPTSASDFSMIDGFYEGDFITIKFWDSSDNKEYETEPSIIEGSTSLSETCQCICYFKKSDDICFFESRLY